MSAEAMEWVFRNSKAKLAARLVLLVIADDAGKDGISSMSLAAISRRAGVSKRGISLCLRILEKMRELDTQRDANHGGANTYTLRGMVSFPQTPENFAGPLKSLHINKRKREAHAFIGPKSIREERRWQLQSELRIGAGPRA